HAEKAGAGHGHSADVRARGGESDSIVEAAHGTAIDLDTRHATVDKDAVDGLGAVAVGAGDGVPSQVKDHVAGGNLNAVGEGAAAVEMGRQNVFARGGQRLPPRGDGDERVWRAAGNGLCLDARLQASLVAPACDWSQKQHDLHEPE